MTVFENDFSQHDNMADRVDHEQYDFNAYIKRIKKNQTQCPHTSYGTIYIDKDADKDEQYFGGILAHESNHIVHDPVNFWNYAEYIDEIKKRLSTTDHMENMLANMASDLIIEYNLSRRYSTTEKDYFLRKLSKYHYEHTINNSADGMKKIMEKVKAEYPEVKIDENKTKSFVSEHMIEFGNIIGKWHGFHIPDTPEPKFYDKVMEILK